MLETDVISRIRHIFLQPRPHVSISQATALLGWTRRQMSEAIRLGEVDLWTTPLGKWFPRSEMMAKAIEIWPLHVIEEALGAEAESILPAGHPHRGAARPAAAASHRHARIQSRPAGDHCERRARP